MEESLLFHSVRYWSSHWSWKHLEVPIPHLQAWWMAIHCRLRLCSFRCWIPNADPRAHSRSKDAERKCWSTKRNPPKTRRSWMGSIYCWIHHLYHLQHLARYGPCLHGSRRKAAMMNAPDPEIYLFMNVTKLFGEDSCEPFELGDGT